LIYYFYDAIIKIRTGSYEEVILIKVNITDIARITGFAKSTVSAALNNKPGVNPETRDKILKTAEQMNYIPNELARGLSSKTSATIGVIVRDITNPFYARMCRAIEQIAYNYGFTIIISNTDGIPDKELNAIRLMIGKMVSGIIVDISGNDLDLFFELRKSNIPYVLFGACQSNVDADCIEADDYKGALRAVEYLVSCGHEKIGFIHGGNDSIYSQRRLNGIKDAFLKFHIQFDDKFILHKAKKMEDGYEMGKRLIGMKDRPTAIIAYNDLVAIGLIKSFEEEGLIVPDFMSIIGFDDIELMTFPLTTVRIPEYDMGVEAAELLISRISGKNTGKFQKIILDTELIIRKSVKSLL
jgi:DNA-binding LacI/PurR family transcriptional regulator